jgi:hypothetical protein
VQFSLALPTIMADFKRPEVNEAFNANGYGKADLVAYPPG